MDKLKLFSKTITKPKKKKNLLLNGSVIIFQNLIFRLTGADLDDFGLAFNSRPFVTMRVVDRGIISKQLVCALGVDG